MKKSRARYIATAIICVLLFLKVYGYEDLNTVLYAAYFPLNFRDVNRLLLSYFGMLLAQIPLFLLWGDLYYENLYRNSTLVFPRLSGTFGILLRSALGLCVRATSFVLLTSVCICIIPIMRQGVNVHSLIVVCNYSLYICFFILLANCFSLIGKPVLGIVVSVLTQAAQFILLCGESNLKIQMLLPGYMIRNVCEGETVTVSLLCDIILVGFILLIICIQSIIAKKAEWR